MGVNHQKLSLKSGEGGVGDNWSPTLFDFLSHVPKGSHWGLSVLQEEAKCRLGSSEEAKALGGWGVTFPNERAGRGSAAQVSPNSFPSQAALIY